MSLSAKGSVAANQVALDWALGVNDLAAADPGLSGAVFKTTGRVSGATDNLSSITDINGGVRGEGDVIGDSAHIAIDGLPAKPRRSDHGARFAARAPVDVAIAMRRQTDGVAIDIQRASWKSLQAGGTLEAADRDHGAHGQRPSGDDAPGGPGASGRTADCRQRAGGARCHRGQAASDVAGRGAAVARTASASRICIGLPTWISLQSHPVLDARLDVASIAASGVSGSLNATAKGPADAIGVKLSAALPRPARRAGAEVSAAATVDTAARTVSVASLQGIGMVCRCNCSRRFGWVFSDGVSIDRLRLGVRPGGARGGWSGGGDAGFDRVAAQPAGRYRGDDFARICLRRDDHR